MSSIDATVRMAAGSLGRIVVARFAPGTELLAGLTQMFEEQGFEYGLILGGAASLISARLRNVDRLPQQWPITDADRVFVDLPGPLELLSVSGNGSRREDGHLHLHLHVVVSTGGADPARCYGGHLVEGAKVLSTAEIVIAEFAGARLLRRLDPQTKTLELVPAGPWPNMCTSRDCRP